MNTRVTSLFGIKFPIVQGGMVWCSGWELASAVSNSGGLGLIGAGSMYPDVLKEHIVKCKKATSQPFGVNVPLLYPDIEELMRIIVDQGVKVVFTSAGNPATWTPFLKEHGITVVHVVSSKKFAIKAGNCHVDAVVAEGFEAGGHNGRDETTTMCLIPDVVDAVNIPVIAAGGIGSGRAMMAAMALGAEGVQIGSLFAASKESSAHQSFKEAVCGAQEGDTKLSLKQVVPVRLLNNKFYEEITRMEQQGATFEEIKSHLGRGRAKKGIFEGDLNEGELEIGQISGQINSIRSANDILLDLVREFDETKTRLLSDS